MLDTFISAIWTGLSPALPWLIPIALFAGVFSATLPGRGPRSAEHDAWRTFKFAARSTVMSRAGGRCEAAAVVFFGRCPDAATEADHIYPWSKGGPTIVSNGAALCRGHNRSKAALNPPWWYVLGLERRRRGYFPDGVDVRVSTVASPEEMAAHRSGSAAVRRADGGRPFG